MGTREIITEIGFGVCMFVCCVSVWIFEIKLEYTTTCRSCTDATKIGDTAGNG